MKFIVPNVWRYILQPTASGDGGIFAGSINRLESSFNTNS